MIIPEETARTVGSNKFPFEIVPKTVPINMLDIIAVVIAIIMAAIHVSFSLYRYVNTITYPVTIMAIKIVINTSKEMPSF